VSRYQKGKTNLDFTEARDSEWQWHQLGHMQVCKSAPSRHNQSKITVNNQRRIAVSCMILSLMFRCLLKFFCPPDKPVCGPGIREAMEMEEKDNVLFC